MVTGTAVSSWTLAAPSRLGPAWVQQFVARYGSAPTAIGLASKPLTLGPEYAAPAKDGTWWVLDAAKKRVTHLNAAGRYLGAVPIPAMMLAQRTYFQFQKPRVLADGTVVAAQQSEGPSDLLVIRSGKPRVQITSKQFVLVADDGKSLYGYAGTTPVRIAPGSGKVVGTAYFRTQAGTRYLITAAPGKLTVALPDVRRTLTVPVGAERVAGQLSPTFEVVGGADGTLHLLLSAPAPNVPGGQLVGYAGVTRDGRLLPSEPLRPLGSAVDPGAAAHLVIASGSSRPCLVFVDDDGLRVFTRR
jgi:hypothetical protein